MSWMDSLKSQDAAFTKAVTFNSSYFPKANTTREGGHKSLLYVNELGILGGTAERWAEKSLGGGLEFLKYMAAQIDVLQAIILTRQRQCAAYARPYSDNDDNPLGYRWIKRDGERLNDRDRKETKRLDQIITNCGTEFDPVIRRYDKRRKTFSGFVSALIADTLTADACPIETELSVKGDLLGWYNIPFDTVRLAHEQGYMGDDEIVAVQVVDRGAVIGLTKDEIVYEVRNPRSDLLYHDYGQSELEHFIRAATSYLNTFTFNAANLDRNSVPRGFLTVYGRYDKRQLNFFRQQWNALVRGAAKRWALPVLVAESKNEGGAQYTPVDTSTTEMFMTKWLVFLVSVLTALYGMAPEEINMESFSAKQSSLSGKDTQEKLQSSHDRGFIPLMTWLENLLNEYIVRRLTQKYILTWVGLHPDDEAQKHERQKLGLTVDELREVDGAEPMADPDMGNAPVNPSLIPLYTQKLMMEKQQDMMGGDPSGALPGSESPLPYDRGGAGANGNGNGNGEGFGMGAGAPGKPMGAAVPGKPMGAKPPALGMKPTQAPQPGKPAPFAKAAPGSQYPRGVSVTFRDLRVDEWGRILPVPTLEDHDRSDR